MSKELLSRENEPRAQGRLIVLTGATGAGKDTIMEKFLEQNSHFKRLVTFATREKRFLQKENRWEEDGIDYHFITDEEFEEMIANGKMIEWVKYDGHYKGTSRQSLERVLAGENIVWRIDISRAGTVESYFKEKFPDIADQLRARTKVVFVGVERLMTLYDRFRGRDKNADRQSFRKRIREEWQHYKMGIFDAIIINRNDKAQEAVDQLSELANSA